MDHRQINQSLQSLWQQLVVSDQASAFHKLAKSPFNHPPLFQQYEALRLLWSQQDLHNPLADIHHPHTDPL